MHAIVTSTGAPTPHPVSSHAPSPSSRPARSNAPAAAIAVNSAGACSRYPYIVLDPIADTNGISPRGIATRNAPPTIIAPAYVAARNPAAAASADADASRRPCANGALFHASHCHSSKHTTPRSSAM